MGAAKGFGRVGVYQGCGRYDALVTSLIMVASHVSHVSPKDRFM